VEGGGTGGRGEDLLIGCCFEPVGRFEGGGLDGMKSDVRRRKKPRSRT